MHYVAPSLRDGGERNNTVHVAAGISYSQTKRRLQNRRKRLRKRKEHCVRKTKQGVSKKTTQVLTRTICTTGTIGVWVRGCTAVEHYFEVEPQNLSRQQSPF